MVGCSLCTARSDGGWVRVTTTEKPEETGTVDLRGHVTLLLGRSRGIAEALATAGSAVGVTARSTEPVAVRTVTRWT
jgi:hypothetical protein